MGLLLLWLLLLIRRTLPSCVCVGERASKVAGWNYMVNDVHTNSRLGVLKDAVSAGLQKQVMKEAGWSDSSWKLVGRTPRWTQWLTRSGCSCPYAYGADVVLPQEFPSWVVDVMREVMPKCGLASEDEWPDSCNVNWYDGGLQGCGWHRDDEVLFQGDVSDVVVP